MKKLLFIEKIGPAFRQHVAQDVMVETIVDTDTAVVPTIVDTDKVYLVTKAQYDAMPANKRMYIPPTL